MVGHGGSSAGSYLADPTSSIPSHCASIVATSTLRVNNLHLITQQIESMNKEQMRETMRKYELKSPSTGNELSDPMEFNLMFSTSIGPSGAVKG